MAIALVGFCRNNSKLLKYIACICLLILFLSTAFGMCFLETANRTLFLSKGMAVIVRGLTVFFDPVLNNLEIVFRLESM